jgi:hypothetical protein
MTRFHFFVVVDGDLLQILGFENLVAVDATQVIDPIPPHQKLRAVVLTGRHTRCRFPYSSQGCDIVKSLLSTFLVL